MLYWTCHYGHSGHATTDIPQWICHSRRATTDVPRWICQWRCRNIRHTTRNVPRWTYHNGHTTMNVPRWTYHNGHTTRNVPQSEESIFSWKYSESNHLTEPGISWTCTARKRNTVHTIRCQWVPAPDGVSQSRPKAPSRGSSVRALLMWGPPMRRYAKGKF